MILMKTPLLVQADENVVACMTDSDDDGFGDDNPSEGVTAGTDCNDDNIDVNPTQLKYHQMV